jgi:adenine-specific DNA-methyltransferase
MHNLSNKDCLEFLKTLPDNSVDLVLTDPPYFIGFDGGKGWDKQWKTEKEYLDWCRQWTQECIRVLKQQKCLYVWGTTKTDTFLKYKLDILNSHSEMVYQNWIIWSYDWGGRTKDKFPRKHEDLLMYSKGKEFDFFADQVLVERAVKIDMNTERKKKLINKFFDSGISKFTEKDLHSWKKYKYDTYSKEKLTNQLEKLNKKEIAFAAGKIPTDVWNKNNHTTSEEYCNWHPTQKPLELLERVIKAHTKEGDTVLDIFSGSGSTMIACQNTGRKFVGCEIDKEYYEKSKIRFKELTKQNSSC